MEFCLEEVVEDPDDGVDVLVGEFIVFEFVEMVFGFLQVMIPIHLYNYADNRLNFSDWAHGSIHLQLRQRQCHV